MSDLITQLAEIRQRQGLEPIPDPRHIQGFGDGQPPPPPFPTFGEPTVTQQDDFDPEPEPEMYVQRTSPAEAPRTEPPPRTALPQLELVVLDTAAAYRGKDVELTPGESNLVKAIVLGALRRDLDALVAEVS